MANTNKVSGLSPVSYLNGSDWDGRANNYYIATDEGNVIAVGDPVKLSGTADANGIPGVVLATAGATCVGVVIQIGAQAGGPYIDADNLALTAAPATKTKAYYALVVDDPMVIFEIQEAGAGAPLAATDVGLNADFVTAAPATGVKVSGTYLNNNAKDTTSTRNLKILGLVRRIDNAYGLYAKWRVLINNHSFKTGVTGI